MYTATLALFLFVAALASTISFLAVAAGFSGE